MKLSEFDYFLPKELIAQEGLPKRDESRLLVCHPSGERAHLFFKDLPNLLQSGDLLIFNDTHVARAKLVGKKESGGKVDCLITHPVLSHTPSATEPMADTPLNRGESPHLIEGKKKDVGKQNGVCEVLLRGSKIRTGTKIIFQNGDKKLRAEVVEKFDGARFKVQFEDPSLVESVAELPLPPYIKQKQKDSSRYQTVYAAKTGSLAAPTAGLHFTPELMEQLKCKGIDFAYLTLHIGIGTFAPIRAENVEEWKMHSEYFQITDESAKKIDEALKNKKRIFAVGTTVVRTLESAYSPHSPPLQRGEIQRGEGWTELFIVPGYRFRFPYAGLLTNFHLPKSTLLLLVCAFAGKERIFSAYQEAIEKKYRFYSFGDAMLILR